MVENVQQITIKYFDHIVNTNKQFLIGFKKYYQDYPYLDGKISTYLDKKVRHFYQQIRELIFVGQDYNDCLQLLKNLLMNLQKYETEQINAQIIINQLYPNDIEERLQQLLEFYGNLLNEVEQEFHHLYTFQSYQNVDYCDYELNCPNSDIVQFNSYFDEENYDQEEVEESTQQTVIEIKDINLNKVKSFRDILELCDLKGNKKLIYFWNIVYNIMNITVTNIDFDFNFYFSFSLFCLIEKSLQEFVLDFHDQIVNEFKLSSKDTEDNMLSAQVNLFSSYVLIRLLPQFVQKQLAKSKEEFIQMENWKGIMQKFFYSFHNLQIQYLQDKLFVHIPSFIIQEKLYYQDCPDFLIIKNIKEPSTCIMKIVTILDNVQSNCQKFMTKYDLENFLFPRVIQYVLYMYEYVLYFEYHNLGKINDVFQIKDLKDRLSINYDPINKQINHANCTIKNFCMSGFNQFIFDMHFLACYFNNNLNTSTDEKNKINNTKFIMKAIQCYCNKSNKHSPKDFNYKIDDIQFKLFSFLEAKYKQWKKVFIEKERQSIFSNESRLSFLVQNVFQPQNYL